MRAISSIIKKSVILSVICVASTASAQSTTTPATATAIPINYSTCNPKTSVEKLKNEADEGQIEAIRAMRSYYEEGCVIDNKLYLHYAELASRIGTSLDAYQYASAIWQVKGIGHALPLFKQAVLQGSIDAATWLGDGYNDGSYGLPKDADSAIFWYRIGAKRGDAYAIVRLIEMLRKSSESKHDNLVEELAWIEVLLNMSPDYSFFSSAEYKNLLKNNAKLKPTLQKVLNPDELRRMEILRNNFLQDINANGGCPNASHDNGG
ncbi:MAG: tetratricopeptide repeat protein [Ktedonobacteraceae bacterium]